MENRLYKIKQEHTTWWQCVHDGAGNSIVPHTLSRARVEWNPLIQRKTNLMYVIQSVGVILGTTTVFSDQSGNAYFVELLELHKTITDMTGWDKLPNFIPTTVYASATVERSLLQEQYRPKQ